MCKNLRKFSEIIQTFPLFSAKLSANHLIDFSRFQEYHECNETQRCERVGLQKDTSESCRAVRGSVAIQAELVAERKG